MEADFWQRIMTRQRKRALLIKILHQKNKTLQIILNRYSKSKPKDYGRSQTIEKAPENVLVTATLISNLYI